MKKLCILLALLSMVSSAFAHNRGRRHHHHRGSHHSHSRGHHHHDHDSDEVAARLLISSLTISLEASSDDDDEYDRVVAQARTDAYAYIAKNQMSELLKETFENVKKQARTNETLKDTKLTDKMLAMILIKETQRK